MTDKAVPVIEGLFSDTAEGPRLLGSRCAACGTPYFPSSAVCHNPECSDSRIEEAFFGPGGTLWSCALQNYPPPPPARYDEPYEPYLLGMVDMDEGLRVMARINAADITAVEIGSRVELELDTLCKGGEGEDVITWKFKVVQP